jgi:tetratricopeptide (TPR) repeat protein
MRRRSIPLAVCALCALLSPVLRSSAQSASPTHKQVISDPAAKELNDLLDAAQAALDRQDFEGAAKNYRDYLAKKPNDAIVHYDLGYIDSALKRPDDAKAEYQRATELDPKMAAAYLNLGVVLMATDPAAAIDPLEKAADLNAGDARTKWVLGTALENAKKLPDAVEQFRAARKLDDADMKIRLSLAHALLASNRDADAETEYRAALALQGTSAEMAQAHRGLEETLLAEKKSPDAAAELAVYLEAHPDDVKARVDHASMLFDLGKYDDSLAELDRAAKSGPEDLPGLKLRSDILWKQKRYADAVVALNKAAALAPRDPDVAARLGEAYLQAKDYANASHWLAAAYNANPGANDVLTYLVDAEYGSKNYSQALAALDALSKREDLPLAGWYVRASCLDNLGQMEPAIEAYQKFLQLNKDQNSDMYFVSTARVRVLIRELQNKKR